MADLEKRIQNIFDEFLNSEVKDLVTSSDKKDVIPTGIDYLDMMLGGGIVLGGMSMWVGRPGCGKSTITASIAKNAQKIYNGNAVVLYLDSEGSMSTYRLKQLGVDNPPIEVKRISTIESIFQVIDAVCKYLEDPKNIKLLDGAPILIIWDSIANTKPEKAFQTDDINQVIGLRARLISNQLPKYLSKMEKYNIALTTVNQLVDQLNMGMFAPAPDLRFMSQDKDIPGGNSLKFNTSQLIFLQERTPLKKEQFGFQGIKVQVKCVKNKLFVPNNPFEIVLDYNRGFSNFWTNFEFLKSVKRITTGAWSYLNDYKEKKFRIKEAPIIYNSNPIFKDIFDITVKYELEKLRRELSVEEELTEPLVIDLESLKQKYNQKIVVESKEEVKISEKENVILQENELSKDNNLEQNKIQED